MENFNGNIIITENQIKEKLIQAADFINSTYDGNPILLVSILKGSFIFLADLCRLVKVPCQIDFMQTESYFNNTESCGKVNITMDLKHDVRNYHLIIIEDIIDTGRTLCEISEILRSRTPLSFHIITLLNKPSRRTVSLNADLSLFTIPDLFVVGYGLDYGEYYRNLPFIAELK